MRLVFDIVVDVVGKSLVVVFAGTLIGFAGSDEFGLLVVVVGEIGNVEFPFLDA